MNLEGGERGGGGRRGGECNCAIEGGLVEEEGEARKEEKEEEETELTRFFGRCERGGEVRGGEVVGESREGGLSEGLGI